MAWTELTFPSGSLLTSAGKINPFFQNLYALANGDAGAPRFQTPAITDGAAQTDKFAGEAVTEDKVAVPLRFPSGTRGIFFQAGAPIGWTQVVDQNDRMLRVVSGVGGGTGGQWGDSSNTSDSGGHAHSTDTQGEHRHTSGEAGDRLAPGTYYTNFAGGHTHPVSTVANHTHTSLDSGWRPAYVNILICSKD